MLSTPSFSTPKALSFVLVVCCSSSCIPPPSVLRFCEGPVANETRIALTDQNRNRLSGAPIVITNLDDGMEWTLETDLAGTADANLPPGRYRVQARGDGFEGESSFEVREGCDTSVTVRLELDDSQESRASMR